MISPSLCRFLLNLPLELSTLFTGHYSWSLSGLTLPEIFLPAATCLQNWLYLWIGSNVKDALFLVCTHDYAILGLEGMEHLALTVHEDGKPQEGQVALSFNGVPADIRVPFGQKHGAALEATACQIGHHLPRTVQK